MTEMLSQNEIDALLGIGKEEAENEISVKEADILGEIGNICMGTSATTLHNIIQKRVTITSPEVRLTNLKELASSYPVPYVVINVSYTEGLKGSNLLILKEEDVHTIVDLMTGSNNSDMGDEFILSAISEVMNQMMGSSSTSMADLLNTKINISAPTAIIARLDDDDISQAIKTDEEIIQVRFKMQIEGHSTSEIMQIMPVKFGKWLVETLAKGMQATESSGNKTYDEVNKNIQEEAIRQEARGDTPVEERKQSHSQISDNPIINAKPMMFTSFDNESQQKSFNENLDIIIDVPLQITVELGKCKKSIKEILELNIGSIIVLNKMAGDLVSIVVNGKIIAKGEVIIIEENYGVRITDIMSSASALKD